MIDAIRRMGEVTDLIIKKRAEKGLSQVELAVFGGYKVPLTYQKKEDGESTIYYNDLEKLFPVLNINMIVKIQYEGELREIENPSHKIFSDFVKGIRKGKKITQKEIAPELGISAASFIYKENCTGNKFFTLKEILLLAEILEFEIDIF